MRRLDAVRGRRFGRLSFAAWTLLLVPAMLTAQSRTVRITFLDVGQGDAIVVQAPEGRAALIDAGPGVDLTPALEALGVKELDLVVATHPDADHIGGMEQVLRSFPVGFYMDNGQPHTTSTYLSLMRELRQRTDIKYLDAMPRMVALGPVGIEVLPMPTAPHDDPNNRSVGLIVRYGDFRAFLSGDSERPELMHFVRAGVVSAVTLMKAPHHGSDAVSDPFLDLARPEVVVISVGYDNAYGHPDPAALLAYRRHAAELYRTDRDGQVTVTGHEDGSYEVSVGAEHMTQGGSPSPTPERATVAPTRGADGATVVIRVVADAPGNDHRNTNGEYAIISNHSERAMGISGWTLCDAARHCFKFPVDASIPVGGSVILYTGHGRNDGVNFFMGSSSAVWNNDGDTATLVDREGRTVARHVY